jgi:hypothetical protein
MINEPGITIGATLLACLIILAALYPKYRKGIACGAIIGGTLIWLTIKIFG